MSITRSLNFFADTVRELVGNPSISSWHLIALKRYEMVLKKRPRWALPFRGRVCQVRLRGISRPFLVRLQTTDLWTLDEIYVRGEYAPTKEFLTGPVHMIVDLGSNVGYSLRWWLDQFPDCRVWAAEPDPGNAALCRKNIQLGGTPDRVKLLEACICGKSGPVYLKQDVPQNSFMVTTNQQGAIRVEGITMDELLADCNQNAIDILKCDIEGSEAELFKFPGNWLKRAKLLIVETHPPYSAEKLLKDLKAAGEDFEPVRSITKSHLEMTVMFLKRKSGAA